jgi:23S rRNA (uracil1939-C5)-methyltransferase
VGVKKGQFLDVEISDVAFGGRGLVRVDGLAVFVDQAAPLDQARIRITRKRKNYAEALLVELIQPSPYRVHAPCAYSGTCGGCKWQFLAYEKQLEYKRRHVAEALDHIGQLRDIPVHETIASPNLFHYRNKMEFTFSERRWLMPGELGKPAVDIDFALGLHVPGTFYKVLDTQACLLQPDPGNTLLGQVREFARASREPVYGLKSHKGFWRFLMLRHSAAEDRWMVNIVTAADKRDHLQLLVDSLRADRPDIAAVVNNVTSRRAGIAQGEYEIHLAGEPFLTDRIGDFEFEISANSFFQTNTSGAERLYDTVTDYAGLTGGERVLDLYSGTGAIAICLSPAAGEVTGIEVVESSVADAVKNCRRNRIANCRFLLGDILNVMPRISDAPDVLIIDPPRGGMHKKVVRQVLDMGAPRVVYVSCNPATLARDLGLMKEHYSVREVQPVDMFPHTYHIEAVARLEKKDHIS